MKYKSLFFIIAASLLSCTDDATNNLSSQNTYGEPVSVTINLAVDSESNGIESSRSDLYGISRGVIDPEEGSLVDNVTKIMNAWVLQYDGTGDDATLVGLPEYIKAKDEEGMTTISSRLIPTTAGAQCTIVVLANTFNESLDFHMRTKLSELKTLVSSVNSPYDVFGYETPFDVVNTDFYPMLNGYVESPIVPGVGLSCSLKRNIARVIVDIRIKNEAVSLSSVKLRGVPQSSFYFTNYANFNENHANTQIPISYADYDAVKSPEPEEGVDDGEYKKFTYTFYVPANIKGTNSNDNELYKNVYAPLGATFLYIYATYPDNTGTGGRVPISYSFFLGANFTNNYNLECNMSYHYVINIDSKGMQYADPRITDMGTVDFTHLAELSNCYILNPPNVHGYARSFKIPVRRVDEFWGNHGYENVPQNMLGSNERWKIVPIWSDFDTNATDADNLGNPYFNIIKNTGYGSEDYFEVAITKGLKGNIVVGIMRVNDSGVSSTDIIWSWHLWITDYNPDVEVSNIDNGQYVYEVTDGHIYRLAGASWESGLYKNAVMMDRNIGALVPPTQNSDAHYVGLVYQYGRKDPFPTTKNFYYFDDKGAQRLASAVPTIKGTATAGEMDKDTFIPHLVHNPTFFVTAYSADLNGNKYSPNPTNADIVWHDPYVTFSGQYPVNGKSIFDPSPLGWKLVTQDAMADVSKTTTNLGYPNNATSFREGFPNYTLDAAGENEYRGLVYWPRIDPWTETVPSSLIYFPVSMIRKQADGTLDCIEVSFWLPRITTNSATNSCEFLVGKTHPIEIYTCSRSYGLNARCVKILQAD